MATGRSDKEQVKEAISFGVNNYIIKPFDAVDHEKAHRSGDRRAVLTAIG